MRLFARGKSKKLTPEQMLSAKPARIVSAKPAPAGEGKWKLTVPLRPARWASFLLRVPSDATKTFELDELGKFVIDQCDGRSSVHQIIHRLSKRYNLNIREAQVATVAFLGTLMRKGVVGMGVKRK